jgi:hypothetical protein
MHNPTPIPEIQIKNKSRHHDRDKISRRNSSFLHNLGRLLHPGTIGRRTLAGISVGSGRHRQQPSTTRH